MLQSFFLWVGGNIDFFSKGENRILCHNDSLFCESVGFFLFLGLFLRKFERQKDFYKTIFFFWTLLFGTVDGGEKVEPLAAKQPTRDKYSSADKGTGGEGDGGKGGLSNFLPILACKTRKHKGQK